jgi:lipoprotein-anchoring transpeptidase ErfK/SrfK
MRPSPDFKRSSHLVAITLVSACVMSFVAVACGGGEPEGPPDAYVVPVDANEDAAPPPPPGPPRRLFAKRFVVKVFAEPDRESARLGFLRAGSVHMSTTHDALHTERCRGGWYGLESGGYVCTGLDVTVFDGRRLPSRPPAQPDYEAPLPYRYMRNHRNNLPVYRRLPTDMEAMIHEGYRPPGIAELPPEVQEAIAAIQPASGPAATAAQEGEVVEGEEREVATLASLRGERGGIVQQYQLRGFVMSVDRDFRVGGRRYWRTLSNGYVPYHALSEVRGSSFQGIALAAPDAEGPHMPVGFVMSSKVARVSRDRQGHPTRARRAEYHDSFTITGEETYRNNRYVVTPEDNLYRAEEVRILTQATEVPEGVGENDKWIDVDLEHQTLVAYEGLRPVYATLVSTGRVRDPDDPNRDMRTPSGLFRITSKHVSHTMDGDHATDGPYSIEDVPYVMYFQLAFALHSAFWHDGFGRPRSHGCVNLSPLDARWIFNWAGPTLPQNWHMVAPRDDNPATWVYIHGETPEG